jgi:hypothetical protein
MERTNISSINIIREVFFVISILFNIVFLFILVNNDLCNEKNNNNFTEYKKRIDLYETKIKIKDKTIDSLLNIKNKSINNIRYYERKIYEIPSTVGSFDDSTIYGELSNYRY